MARPRRPTHACAAWSATPPTPAPQSGSPPSLAITPDTSTYPSRTQINLTLQLTNVGASECQLSNVVDGSIVVDTYIQNGVDLTPTAPSAPLLIDQSLGNIIVQSLTPINPGDSISVVWSSAVNNLTGGQGFESVTWSGDDVPDGAVLRRRHAGELCAAGALPPARRAGRPARRLHHAVQHGDRHLRGDALAGGDLRRQSLERH